jgi:hypothetical protein
MATELTYLHPSVYSNIDSTESTYQTADGVSNLFVADVFEKGKDNKTVLVSSADEFTSLYGEPNYAKYGQAAYNVMNWLENGGSAYILRVLPDDAQYAHAVLNIQTKLETNGKVIAKEDGELVKFNNVKLRPIISYLKANNTDSDSIETEVMTDRSSETTVDGYTNNFLFGIYPVGRGSSYNNLGFRISLNKYYDTSMDYRVYNFEIIRYDEYSNIISVEGPYQVTFDPDALDSSNNSMFIEDVVNRHSDLVTIKFNTEAYLRITDLINPNVDPGVIDVLTGKSRNLINGNTETYYDESVEKDLDIHVTLEKFDSEGQLILSNSEPVLNIVDYDDTIEQSIISLDNSVRERDYTSLSDRLSYMKTFYPSLGTTKFRTSHLNPILRYTCKFPSGVYDIENDVITEYAKGKIVDNINELFTNTTKGINGDNPSIKDRYDYVKNVIDTKLDKLNKDTKDEYTLTTIGLSDSEFASFDSVVNGIITSTENLLDYYNRINAAYKLTLHNESNPALYLSFTEYQEYINSNISLEQQIKIASTAHKDSILGISTELMEYNLGNYDGDELEELSVIINNVYEEFKYVRDSFIPLCIGDIDNVDTYVKDMKENFLGSSTKQNKQQVKVNDLGEPVNEKNEVVEDEDDYIYEDVLDDDGQPVQELVEDTSTIFYKYNNIKKLLTYIEDGYIFDSDDDPNAIYTAKQTIYEAINDIIDYLDASITVLAYISDCNLFYDLTQADSITDGTSEDINDVITEDSEEMDTDPDDISARKSNKQLITASFIVSATVLSNIWLLPIQFIQMMI